MTVASRSKRGFPSVVDEIAARRRADIRAEVAATSLADQIDRLDGILDGLAEALNESVADAVKDVIARVVREAVQTAVTEVLSSPALLRAALETHAPPPIPDPFAMELKPPTLKENVARIAPCPVLVVREEEHEFLRA